MRILIVEDELRMVELLRKGLSEHGHRVTTARDGTEGLRLSLAYEFDVVLLDIGLPDMNGFELAKLLREREKQVSILMLTAYSKEDEIVRGLNLGADDYLTKPFSFPELLARLRSLARALPERVPSPVVVLDGLAIDRAQRRVSCKGRTIDLTRMEFRLLELLSLHAPDAVMRSELICGIWGSRREVTSGTLDVLVNSLRGKIDAPFENRLVQTIRGVGYALQTRSKMKACSTEELA